jgi:hypothetical protein
MEGYPACPTMQPCSLNLHLDDSSAKQALGWGDDVKIELHTT